MSVKEVVQKFGGQTALSKLVGVNQSAIAYWVKQDSIPSKWHASILELAEKYAISITASDLINFHCNMPPSTAIQYVSNISIEKFDGAVDKLEPSIEETSQFLFYAASDGAIKVQVILGDETVWASQKGMGEIFNVESNTINYHLKEIFTSRELDETAVTRKIRVTAFDGKNYDTNFYNLDAIISVSYRVNSHQATQFRKWATTVIKSYLIKGFALDDDRLKQGGQLFGKDYFNELLERIREIRASERRFYQKITDIYSQCSIDYDKDALISQQFYAHVQDKLHYAIHGHTSAELIQLRADASKPNMGLFSYKNEKTGGKVTKLDVTVGKNYLNEEEINDLNRLVSMYLDFAENFARRKISMKMSDWAAKLDGFLQFNAYDVLASYGGTQRISAEKSALSEYKKFRVIQDQKFESDFDKIVDEVKTKNQLPKA